MSVPHRSIARAHYSALVSHAERKDKREERIDKNVFDLSVELPLVCICVCERVFVLTLMEGL